MIWQLLILLSAYSFLIAILIFGFLKSNSQKTKFLKSETGFSVLVPFRNEANNLRFLLNSFKALDYDADLFEILLIDDESTDDSVTIVTAFSAKNPGLRLKILDTERSSGSPKKDALKAGVANAQNEWIVTTDADCIIPENWLKSYEQFILQNPAYDFIAASVTLMDCPKKMLSAFQKLDFLSLQGATIGSFGIGFPFMCNGANLAYKKSRFLKLDGYSGTDQISSGDDVLLMQKFLKDDEGSVGYLNSRDALVLTQAEPSWSQLISQRKRWAAKASVYKNRFGILVSGLVFLGNLAFIPALFYPKLYPLLIIKLVLDFTLIALTAHFTAQKKVLIHYLWSMLLYPFMTVYIVFSSQTDTYTWKGREFKK